jgi:hypothetical protein
MLVLLTPERICKRPVNVSLSSVTQTWDGPARIQYRTNFERLVSTIGAQLGWSNVPTSGFIADFVTPTGEILEAKGWAKTQTVVLDDVESAYGFWQYISTTFDGQQPQDRGQLKSPWRSSKSERQSVQESFARLLAPRSHSRVQGLTDRDVRWIVAEMQAELRAATFASIHEARLRLLIRAHIAVATRVFHDTRWFGPSHPTPRTVRDRLLSFDLWTGNPPPTRCCSTPARRRSLIDKRITTPGNGYATVQGRPHGRDLPHACVCGRNSARGAPGVVDHEAVDACA